MAKGDKYIALKKYLENSAQPQIILAYKEIEGIICSKLPKSAYQYSEAWWANDYTHSQAIAWIDAGYETDFVSDTFKDEKIIFVKL